MPTPTEFVIPVTSEDPKKKKKEEKEEETPKVDEKKDEKKDDDADELSEEDQQLKSDCEMHVERLKESNQSLYQPTLQSLRTIIRSATSSMTSVPKPLKFLRPFYPELKTLFDTWKESAEKALFAEILSVLAMTYSDTEPRGTLRYRLLAHEIRQNQDEDPGEWGHEYVRHLAAELGEEFTWREEQAETQDASPDSTFVPLPLTELNPLALVCAKFLLHHNAEPDAVDLLQELEIIEQIVELVDENIFARVAQYMVASIAFLPPPDDITFLETIYAIYVKFGQWPESISIAVRLGSREKVKDVWQSVGNPVMRRQLAFVLARLQVPTEWITDGEEDELAEDLIQALSNTRLSAFHKEFGKEMGVLDPKTPEDVYKVHLESGRGPSSSTIDSARGNLASTFVNAFVNAGFGNDKLMLGAGEGESWVYKNKEHGMMSAAASLGMLTMWDSENGLGEIDKFTYSSEEWIKAGTSIAIGIVSASVRSETDAPLALLSDHLENKSVPLKTGALVGLGLAYTSTHRADLSGLLLPIIQDDAESLEVVALASLALGLIFAGSADGEVTGGILQSILERVEQETEQRKEGEAWRKDEKSLCGKWGRFLSLGLGLVYLGTQDQSDATIETLKALAPHPISKLAQVIVESCSYAGTGNVLRVQGMLYWCDATEDKEEKDSATTATTGAEGGTPASPAAAAAASGSEPKKEDVDKDADKEKEKPDDTFQQFAVLGIALISMGEDVGAQMSLRVFNHLMHYGSPTIRQTVPLALALLSASSSSSLSLGPSSQSQTLMETLSKYSHDGDLKVAISSIFALGLIGVGSNNAKINQMLRGLAGYYKGEADCSFAVRIAQGFVAMGKGTIGIGGWAMDRSVMVKGAIAGLLSTVVAMGDAKGFVLDKYHWMLYLLAPAMYPRFLITLNEDNESIPVTVRVGQALDTTALAGKPRTISGFQTHTTPVRLGATERAELGSEEWITYAGVRGLEGVVVLRKNPGWEKEDSDRKESKMES